MGDKKSAKSPLLYIHQPYVRTPEASMQSHYMTPKKQRDDKKKERNKAIKRPVNRNHFKKPIETEETEEAEKAEGSEETEEQLESTEEDNSDLKDGGKERKKFSEMTVEERIEYFLNPPKYAPVMRCEVKTKERRYRGAIIDFQDKKVYMRVGRRTTPTTIPIDEIDEIRMIGF
ncbi:CotO family spore coat protein [Lentibacillus jeotgali]|uniref:CotO family spore coat protein n=1 Tax=Lentibacillus jeotgali TaxID=558169 RepID=UPI0002627801|nr:CotO family spore coat protein [Lentibacillus jeotgali]